MMTLDELLSETGVKDLGGARGTTKTAAPEKANFSKLAERCRRAAIATPGERASSDEQVLAEKTAAVAVISRTLAEIREIEGIGGGEVKTAAPTGKPFPVETFIKQALDKGYAPDQIAVFLEKHGGIVDRVKGAVREFRAGRAVQKAEHLSEKAKAVGGQSLRMWEDHVRRAATMDEAGKANLISRMRIKLGDGKAAALVKDEPSLREIAAGKDLLKSHSAAQAKVPGAAKPTAVGLNVGGAHMGLTGDQLNKLKKPAALLGAGYLGARALGAGKSENDSPSKKGVVIVNS